jgi:hypothetical protein
MNVSLNHSLDHRTQNTKFNKNKCMHTFFLYIIYHNIIDVCIIVVLKSSVDTHSLFAGNVLIIISIDKSLAALDHRTQNTAFNNNKSTIPFLHFFYCFHLPLPVWVYSCIIIILIVMRECVECVIGEIIFRR